MRQLTPLFVCALLIPALATAQEPAPSSNSADGEAVVETTGELGRGDAKRDNGAYTDTYTFRASAGDTVRAEVRATSFDTYIILHSPSGATETNDDHEGSSDYSQVTVTADESGLWMMEVTSFKKKEKGSYAAMATVWGGGSGPAEPRSVVESEDSGSVDGGTFTFNGSLSSGDSTLDNGEYADAHTFQANQGQTIVADLRSTAFDTYVGLISPSGEVTQNDDFEGSSDHSRAVATADVGGEWTLLTTSYKADESGSYEATVTVGSTDGDENAIVNISGTLASDDFVLDNGEYADATTFEATAGDELTAVLTSTAFDTFVLLRSPSGETWGNDDFENSKSRSQFTVTADQSGEWTLVTTSYAAAETGAYQARVDRAAGSTTTTATSTAGGDNQSGNLASGDTTLDSGEYVDSFSIKGRQGEHLVVDLRSDSFDTYVALRAPSGEVWQNDDHDNSSNRSQVSVELPETGDYEVMVTSYRPGETGSWTANVTRGSGAVANGLREERGSLGQGDGQINTGEYMDLHTFEGMPGQHVRIDLASTDFDTYLVLKDPNEENSENDDSPEGNGHSLIEMDITEAGTYTIGVTSYKPEEVGAYTLTIDMTASTGAVATAQRDVSRLESGETMSGVLESGDDTLDSGEFRDVYTFEGTAGDNVSVVLESSAFDPYLGLVTPSDEIIQNDDWDSRQDMSRIDLTLPESGRYRVVSTSYRPGDSGAYDLVVNTGGSIQGQSAATASAVDGGVFGVFVGISDYPGEGNDLDFTAEDAQVLSDAFTGSAGMLAQNSIVLTDSAATMSAVREAVATMGQRMDDGDRFVFFYSGHGARIAHEGDFQAADPDGQDETLVLYDGMITDDDFGTLLDGVPGTALIVLDACFSGGFAKDIITKPGRMGLFSSHEDVTSAVARKFRAGGYLARFMAEAVGTHAADDGDGQLTALELSQYLYDRYRTDVKSYDPDAAVADAGDKSAPVDIVLASRNLGFQQLIVDRGGVNPYQVLFTW